jgi:hypothetical protein
MTTKSLQAEAFVLCTCRATLNIGMPQCSSCTLGKKNSTEEFIQKMISKELHFCSSMLSFDSIINRFHADVLLTS